MDKPHIPVLLEEMLRIFEGMQIRVFFEGTVGAGGHARSILERHPEIERYFACDRDPKALALAKKNLAPWAEKIEWIHGSFSDLGSFLQTSSVAGIDGFLIDIGVSSMQFDEGERGFSFRTDAPLDMRMNPEAEVTAERLINTLSEEALAKIFHEYGEEPRSRPAAKAIAIARKKRPIRTTHQLVAVLEPVLRKGKIHFATRVFQALRIAVNEELDQLKLGLSAAIERLNPGGRLAVISFHSLEDRIVKWRLREEKGLNILTKKPICPSIEEMRKNPRSRSAKLRGAEKREEES